MKYPLRRARREMPSSAEWCSLPPARLSVFILFPFREQSRMDWNANRCRLNFELLSIGWCRRGRRLVFAVRPVYTENKRPLPNQSQRDWKKVQVDRKSSGPNELVCSIATRIRAIFFIDFKNIFSLSLSRDAVSMVLIRLYLFSRSNVAILFSFKIIFEIIK